jgi:hypothetical protein
VVKVEGAASALPGCWVITQGSSAWEPKPERPGKESSFSHAGEGQSGRTVKMISGIIHCPWEPGQLGRSPYLRLL